MMWPSHDPTLQQTSRHQIKAQNITTMERQKARSQQTNDLASRWSVALYTFYRHIFLCYVVFFGLEASAPACRGTAGQVCIAFLSQKPQENEKFQYFYTLPMYGFYSGNYLFIFWWTILSCTLRISLWTWCTKSFFSRFTSIPHFSTFFSELPPPHSYFVLWTKLRIFSTGLCFTFCLLFWFPCRNLLHLIFFWFFSNLVHSILLWI